MPGTARVCQLCQGSLTSGRVVTLPKTGEGGRRYAHQACVERRDGVPGLPGVPPQR